MVVDDSPAFWEILEYDREQTFLGRILEGKLPSSQNISKIFRQNLDLDIGKIQLPHIFSRIALFIPGEEGLPASEPFIIRLKGKIF